MKSFFTKLINKSAIILSPCITFLERKVILKYASQPLKHQPIFIIGAPRTGSTILYQALTNNYEVSYIDNLISIFYKNIFFGFWLSDFFYRNKSHDNFKATHGNTLDFGGHAPSECGEFWYRWLPRDSHFVDSDDCGEEVIQEIRNQVTAIINFTNKPLLFKNLNAGQRLRLLVRAFPNAKFIYIRRDPLFTASSILKARRKVGVNANDWWGIQPRNYQSLVKLEEIDMCVAQIYYIEKQINEDIKLFDKNNLIIVNYNELSERCVVGIAKKYNLAKKQKTVFPSFIKDETCRLDTKSIELTQKYIRKYPFERDVFNEK
ncbi:MAG: hypothetical protein ACI9OE_002424 [Mariniflexile sp.]|jgi:hypothetical protein